MLRRRSTARRGLNGPRAGCLASAFSLLSVSWRVGSWFISQVFQGCCCGGGNLELLSAPIKTLRLVVHVVYFGPCGAFKTRKVHCVESPAERCSSWVGVLSPAANHGPHGVFGFLLSSVPTALERLSIFTAKCFFQFHVRKLNGCFVLCISNELQVPRSTAAPVSLMRERLLFEDNCK